MILVDCFDKRQRNKERKILYRFSVNHVHVYQPGLRFNSTLIRNIYIMWHSKFNYQNSISLKSSVTLAWVDQKLLISIVVTESLFTTVSFYINCRERCRFHRGHYWNRELKVTSCQFSSFFYFEITARSLICQPSMVWLQNSHGHERYLRVIQRAFSKFSKIRQYVKLWKYEWRGLRS